MAFSGAGFFYICTSADAANAGAIHMHVATHADVACDMQIDDDNGKMMSAIMRMVSGVGSLCRLHSYASDPWYAGGGVGRLATVAQEDHSWGGQLDSGTLGSVTDEEPGLQKATFLGFCVVLICG